MRLPPFLPRPALWRRALRKRRRTLAALAVGLLAVATVSAVLPPGGGSVEVTVLAHDVAPGRTLTEQDLDTVPVARALAPEATGAAPEEILGRRVRIPLPAGSMLTDAVLESETETVPAGTAVLAIPVDATIAGRLSPGSRLRLVLGTPSDEPGATASVPARVIRPAPETDEPKNAAMSGSFTSGSPPLMLVSVSSSDLARVVQALHEGWVACAIVG